MKKKLRISTGLSLPADTVTSTLIVYGGKGMGKTNFGGVLVEELDAARLRFSVIDPMGVWWGLRHGPDGKGPGVEVVILGGIHGDFPITPESGDLVADMIVDEDASFIIDISRRADGSMWAISERIRFVRDYTKRMYQRQGEKRRPIHQVIDEAARFAPQIVRQGESEVAACMGAIAVLVEEGRNVGIGVTLLTQRSARLNKDVAELADCMIAFRIVGPNSMRAVLDWLGEHVEKRRLKEIGEKVRALPRGSALVVSPGWLEFEGIAAMRKRWTFDSSKTPEAGKQLRASGAGAKPDLAKYRVRLAELIEHQKANDPKALKTELVKLRADIAKLQAAKAPKPPKDRIVEKKVEFIKPADLRRMEAIMKRIDKVVARITIIEERFGVELSGLRVEVTTIKEIGNRITQFHTSGKVPRGATAELAIKLPGITKPGIAEKLAERELAAQSRPVKPPPAPRSSATTPTADDDGKPLPIGEEKTLRALIQFPDGLEKPALRGLTDYTRSSSNSYLQRLGARGLAVVSGRKAIATAAGFARLPDAEPLPTGQALVDYWHAHLPIGEWKVLEQLIKAGGDAVDSETIDTATGYTRSSRNSYLQRLGVKALAIRVIGGHAAAPVLFEAV